MFIAGGDWNNGANAGAFAVNGNEARSNANGNIGFRAAYPHVRYCAPKGRNQYKGIIRDLLLSPVMSGEKCLAMGSASVYGALP